jgi:hypothetical protein
VKVVMEIDTEPRIVVVPEDFQKALENHTKRRRPLKLSLTRTKKSLQQY